ncbi:MAG: DUF4430 domain-containing protein [Syntrophomonadaceae bacterium]|nr:DUF4430 domain-containing protein [Syntrophomonadaceae bacterium]
MKQMRPKYINTIILIGAVLCLLTVAFFWGDSPEKSSEAGRVQSSQAVAGSNDKKASVPEKTAVSKLQKAGNTSVAEATDQAQTAVGQDSSRAAGAGKDTAALANTCTLAVKCTTILDHMDKFDNRKLQVLPPDGVIFPGTTVAFLQGESAFDVLQREMKKAGLHLEFTSVPLYKSNYIEGIGNIYELDCGELSGWVYRVNGLVPGYGCNLYELKDGDVVEFVYTCNLGRDVGGNNFQGE